MSAITFHEDYRPLPLLFNVPDTAASRSKHTKNRTAFQSTTLKPVALSVGPEHTPGAIRRECFWSSSTQKEPRALVIRRHLAVPGDTVSAAIRGTGCF